MSNRNSYSFYLTGKKSNDAAVLGTIGDCPYVFFDLPYTAPYQEFHSIKDFQRASTYRPFQDEPDRRKIAIIDLWEWLGHEEEEYLEIFMQFLHDYRPFFDYEYIFTAGAAGRAEIKQLRILLAHYFHGGEIVEDRTLTDAAELGRYIRQHYSVERNVADRCAAIMAGYGIEALSQVDLFMEDLILRAKPDRRLRLNEKTLLLSPQLENNSFFIAYENAVRKWRVQKAADYDMKETEEIAE